MFKIKLNPPEFKTMDEVKAKTYLSLSRVILMKGVDKKQPYSLMRHNGLAKFCFLRRRANTDRLLIQYYIQIKIKMQASHGEISTTT